MSIKDFFKKKREPEMVLENGQIPRCCDTELHNLDVFITDVKKFAVSMVGYVEYVELILSENDYLDIEEVLSREYTRHLYFPPRWNKCYKGVRIKKTKTVEKGVYLILCNAHGDVYDNDTYPLPDLPKKVDHSLVPMK